MTSIAGVSCNFEYFPIELQNKIYEYLTLEDLLTLKRTELSYFESISLYIDYYFRNEKYKEQSRLKDCMYLLNFEEYRELIYNHLDDLVITLCKTFYHDITKSGGPIGYRKLAQEVNPRNIYTIKIEMVKDLSEVIYHKINSIGMYEDDSLLYLDCGDIRPPGCKTIMSFDVITIINHLLAIVNSMRQNNIRIKSIHYYKETYADQFLLNTIRPRPLVTFIHYI
jgi:hypothetical protein